MNSKTLVINAGSSSIKWALFVTYNLQIVASGLAERIGIDGVINCNFNGQKNSQNSILKNHSDAVKEIILQWKKLQIIQDIQEIEFIGFRVVHGASFFSKATKLDEKSIKIIESCSKFAPLHNPGAISAIRAFQKIIPSAKLSASFDTAFHTTIPKINFTYPINADLNEKYQIKKYGFHGISHKFISQKMEQILQKKSVNILNMHLGNGSSLCAIKNSKSIDTTMGFTPLAGLMMGTRSGDIDPSIAEFICKEKNISISEFTEILNKRSGLLGISQISADVRDLVEKSLQKNENATFALDLFSQKIADYAINFINKIGPKIEAIVFTAGIGENSYYIRNLVIDKIKILNLKLDPNLNDVAYNKIGSWQKISSSDSQIPIYVVRTNEELLIAQDTIKNYQNQ